MAEDLLAQGIAAVKTGNIQEARKLLDAAIRAAPNDIRGWGWFFNVCQTDTERLRCIKEILRIDPNNDNAKQKYNELIGLGFQSPAPGPQKAQVASISNIKSSQPINNKKGGISTLEWVLIGILGGAAILTIAALGITFLFNIFHSPAAQVPSYPAPFPTNTVIYPTKPAVQALPPPVMPDFPTMAPLPTMKPFPTFPPPDTPQPTETPFPTITSGPLFTPQTKQIGPINDTERDTSYSMEITVNDVKWLTSDSYYVPKPGSIYAVVYMKAKNLGPGSVQALGIYDFQTLDNKGVLHDYTLLSSIVNTCNFNYADILPNGELEGCVAFEVPISGKLEFIYAPYQHDPLGSGRYLSIVIRQN